MTESGSDIEISSKIDKKPKKLVKTFTVQELLVEAKKPTTKQMIHQALEDLHTKKGVSLHAIKKYMTENHSVDTAKIGYLIKKHVRLGVENGSIIQTKGIGVSGSFKLAPEKRKQTTKKEMKPKKEETAEKSKVKPKMKKSKTDEDKPKTEKKAVKTTKTAPAKEKAERESKNEKPTKKTKKEVKTTNEEEIEKPTVKKRKLMKQAALEDALENPKIAKEVKKKTVKRKSLVRRKSIGSIIKPPKMKPKARA